jgi:RNA polymerase sigma factor (sigma-70 family)
MRAKGAPHQNNIDPERLFEEILSDIPLVVHRACRSLGHRPTQMEFEGIVHQAVLLLIDRDYYTLRSFRRLSSLQTWLFTIVRRYLVRQIQKQSREMSLEDLPRASLSAQPAQEKTLIAKEKMKWLSVAVNKLTSRERKLFQLLCKDGLSASEIAKEMGIKRESVYSERFALIVKIRRMIREDSGNDRPNRYR